MGFAKSSNQETVEHTENGAQSPQMDTMGLIPTWYRGRLRSAFIMSTAKSLAILIAVIADEILAAYCLAGDTDQAYTEIDKALVVCFAVILAALLPAFLLYMKEQWSMLTRGTGHFLVVTETLLDAVAASCKNQSNDGKSSTANGQYNDLSLRLSEATRAYETAMRRGGKRETEEAALKSRLHAIGFYCVGSE